MVSINLFSQIYFTSIFNRIIVFFFFTDTWPKRKDGHLSTSGTTATVVILRESKIFIGHVGDSAAVIAQKKNNAYIAKELTVDHKPESVKEKTRYFIFIYKLVYV